MERITSDTMLMEIARLVSRRGTCARLSVGAVFSKQGRIIVTGYNGAPAGLPHCNHRCDCIPVDGIHDSVCESLTPCITSVHAEQNAIAFAAKHGLSLADSELHVTDAPCLSCAQSLVNAGVTRVTYSRNYRLPQGVELLASAGIQVVDYSTME